MQVGLLLMAQTMSMLSTRTIESIYQTYGKALFDGDSSKSISQAQKVRHFGNEAKLCASSLLAIYVFEESSKSCMDIRILYLTFDPVDDQPSILWTKFLAKLKHDSDIIEQLFPDDGTLARKEQKRLNSLDNLVKPRVGKSGLSLNIDKLFAEKVEVFPSSIGGTRGEILTALIKAVLKVSVRCWG
jgi:hypothetical protein